MTKLKTILITVVLSTLSLTSNAGQLYRFLNEDGISTTSRSLPPSAAQKGYDILNDKTLRLIERIPPALTKEEIAEEKRQIAHEKESTELASIKAEEEEKQQKQQDLYDKNLIASYLTEEDLIKKRDSALRYKQIQIDKIKANLEKSKLYSFTLQQQAAEQELAGRELSVNLKKRLQANQDDINNSKQSIESLGHEAQLLTEKYASNLARLRYLLTKSATNQ